MPTILLLCEYSTLNGGEQSMLATLEGVRRAGLSVTVATRAEGPLADELRAHEVEVIPFRVTDSQGQHRPQSDLRRELGELIRMRRPALVHANSLSMGRLAGPVVAELGVPSLAHLRDILRLSRQAIADLSRNTRLLAVSEATRSYHVARGLDPAKTVVLHNGVDLVRFQPRAGTGYLGWELGLPSGARLIGTIGQIGLRKGQDVLAAAAPRILQSFPDAHFLVIGERNSTKAESRDFEAAFQEAASWLAGRFHFLGVRRDLPQILNELTLLVHPARQEPLGRVLLEAAASGLPVVATNVGGTVEIFPPGSNSAWLVSPDDMAALAEAVSVLLSDDPLRRAMAVEARRRAEDSFDAKQAAAGLIHHYRQLIGGTR